MAKKKDLSWTVKREYKNRYSLEELVRRIIRRHLEFPDMNELSKKGSET